MSIPDGFDQPEMWNTYSDLKRPTYLLLTEPDLEVKDGRWLTQWAADVDRLGMHGHVAGLALTWGALGELGDLLGKHPRTIVAMLGRAPHWRDPAGKQIQNIVSSWGHGSHAQVFSWVEQLEESAPRRLSGGLGERLIFAVETAALWSGVSSEERGRDFCKRFFANIT